MSRNKQKTIKEKVQDLNGIMEKVQDSEVDDQTKEKLEILQQVKALNENNETDELVMPEPKEGETLSTDIKPKKPRFKIKEKSLVKTEDISTKITEEQLNMLTYTVTQGVCMYLDREDMALADTMPFSKVLFEIGMQQGWFNNMSFLPYLVLIGAGFDLTMKVAKKPRKHSKQERVIEQVIPDKIQHIPDSVPTNAELGKVDLVDSEALVKKLGGGRLYTAVPTDAE